MQPSAAWFAPDLGAQLAAHWNRGPQVFKGALRSPVFSDQDLMAGILGTAREYAARPLAVPPPGRVFVGGETVTPERLGPFLPPHTACRFAEYAAQIRAAHPRDEVGIILDRCEKHVPAVRERTTPLLHQLFATVGYPARSIHACIYAGTYKTTPFGIHRDDCHVLMFCGVGRKTMAFWPRPYFDQKPELFREGKLQARVEEHRTAATVLTIGPQDALYWPAADWHVALAEDDQFQAALSLGIYHDGSSAEKLAGFDFLGELARDRELDLPGLPGGAGGRLEAADLTSPMAAFFARWERLRETLARPEEAAFRALEMALRSASSAGFGKLLSPPLLSADSGRHWRCPVPESLVVARVRGGLMVGANGSVFFYAPVPEGVESALDRLRAGESVPGSGPLADFARAGALVAAD